MSMLHSYLLFAKRNLARNKIYSMINIAGLAIGLAVFGMMALYIADELSYDRGSVNAGRIYRLVQSGSWSGGNFKLAITSPPMGPALKKDFPEVESVVRIDAEGGGTLVYDNKKIEVRDMLFVDSSVVTVFQFPFLYGDPASALTAPHSMVMTRTLAEKLFGHAEDALNKTVVIEHDGPNQVTGVIEDQPKSSHLQFSALRTFTPPANDGWRNAYLYTYVLLREHASAERLKARLPNA